MTRILKAEQKSIALAAEIIKQGGLVAFPTETVYGLGANALDPDAVLKIFQAKQRPAFDPLIVHIAKKEELTDYCLDIPDITEKLVNTFWPGPFTIILKKNKSIPDIVTSGLDTVAIRLPRSRIARELISLAGTPIAAPSANQFGYISPTRPEFVLEQLGNKIDLVLDDGPTSIGIESTVISLTEEPLLLRPGGIPIEEIRKILPDIKTIRETGKIEAPGQMKSHYAPRTPLGFFNADSRDCDYTNCGLLSFDGKVINKEFKAVEVLSSSGDYSEAAKNLFYLLYKLDKMGLEKIYVEPVPEIDLGIAIMDRLRKAMGTKG